MSLGFCEECGAKIASGSKFCDECGAAVNAPNGKELKSTTTHKTESKDSPRGKDDNKAAETVKSGKTPKPKKKLSKQTKRRLLFAGIFIALAAIISSGVYLFFLRTEVTREEFARMVIERFEEPNEIEPIFSDVETDSDFNPYAAAMVRRGIVSAGEIGDEFRKDESITREDAAVWMARALGVFARGVELEFRDSSHIEHPLEVATALEFDLMEGKFGNRFVPGGTITRRQADRMIYALEQAYRRVHGWDREEVLHYVYQDSVRVISNASSFTVEEADDGTITIIVTNPTPYIRALSVGDTFVFEATDTNPFAAAGIVSSASHTSTTSTIIARAPDQIEDILYEFEFVSQFNALDGDSEIVLSEEFYELGVEITENPNRLRTISFNNVNVRGINLEGAIVLYHPTVRADLNLRGVNELSVSMEASMRLAATASFRFDEVLPLFTIRKPVGPVSMEIPVGLRMTASGEFVLVLEANAQASAGLMRTENGRIEMGRFNMDTNFHFEFEAHVSVALNIQARARLFSFINIYAVEGRFGRGFESSSAISARCPNARFVVEAFPVRRVTSVDSFGLARHMEILRFTSDFTNEYRDARFLTNAGWGNSCPESPEVLHPLVGRWDVADAEQTFWFFDDGRGVFLQAGSGVSFDWTSEDGWLILSDGRRLQYSATASTLTTQGTLDSATGAVQNASTAVTFTRSNAEGRLRIDPRLVGNWATSGATTETEYQLSANGSFTLITQFGGFQPQSSFGTWGVIDGQALLVGSDNTARILGFDVQNNRLSLADGMALERRVRARIIGGGSLDPDFEGEIEMRLAELVYEEVGDHLRFAANRFTGRNGSISIGVPSVRFGDSNPGDVSNFVIYRLHGAATTLTATLTPPRGAVGFVIRYRFYGDGRQLYESPMLGSRAMNVPVEVDIRGVDMLRIEVEYIHYGNCPAWSGCSRGNAGQLIGAVIRNF